MEQHNDSIALDLSHKVAALKDVSHLSYVDYWWLVYFTLFSRLCPLLSCFLISNVCSHYVMLVEVSLLLVVLYKRNTISPFC